MVDFKKGVPTPTIKKSGYDFGSPEAYIKFFHSKGKGLKLLPVSEILEKIKNNDKDFSNVRIVGVDWRGRDLSGFDFSGSKLEWNLFTGCKLIGANFSNTYMDFCVFDKAELSKADFRGSLVWDCLFEDAIKDKTDFSDSDIRYASFINCNINANINAANFDNVTKFNFFTSWDEIGKYIENVNFDTSIAMRLLNTLNIPHSKILVFKTMMENIAKRAENFKAIYLVGSRFANPYGDLYNSKSNRTENIDRYFSQSGIYFDKEGAYTKKTFYGHKNKKQDRRIYGK